MTRQRKGDDSFFIGWGETPAIDRRFLLRSSLALIAVAGGLGALIAANQQPAGDGTWNPDDERDWAGVLVREPYPALRTLALDGTPRTAYLVSSDKHGVQHRLGPAAEGPVLVRGSLIARGKNAMIAVADGDNWMRASTVAEPRLGDALSSWTETDLGEATYAGEILDSKCWFGAMQPGQGKPHKSCASLCIRGGLPAVFCMGSVCGSATSIPLLTQADGHTHGIEILPFVADPVIASGRLVKIGDVTQFRVAFADIKRL